MNEPFTVRDATLDDCDEIRGLLAEVDELHRLHLPWLFQKPSAEPRPSNFFERLLADGDSALLVADAGARIVGVATALLRTSPEFALFVRQSWGVLDNIAVSKSWRRRGVGTALIRSSERWAESRGASFIELGVYEFNDEARAFYRTLGYCPVSTKLRKPFHGTR